MVCVRSQVRIPHEGCVFILCRNGPAIYTLPMEYGIDRSELEINLLNCIIINQTLSHLAGTLPRSPAGKIGRGYKIPT